MYHNQLLFPSATKIVEILSTNPNAAQILQPRLLSIKDELQGLPLKDNFINQINQQEIPNPNAFGAPSVVNEVEVNSEEKRLVSEVKETMTNIGAIQLLDKLQSENNLTTEQLRQLTVILAEKCGISTQPNQFKTLDLIYRWFDANWDIIEPNTTGMLIVNCDSK